MTGEGRFAFEAGDPGGFADEFGSSQLSTPGHGQQCRGDLTDAITDALGLTR